MRDVFAFNCIVGDPHTLRYCFIIAKIERRLSLNPDSDLRGKLSQLGLAESPGAHREDKCSKPRIYHIRFLKSPRESTVANDVFGDLLLLFPGQLDGLFFAPGAGMFFSMSEYVTEMVPCAGVFTVAI